MMSLNFDNPESVKLQVRQISLGQKRLGVIKKEVTAQMKAIGRNLSQAGADNWVSVAHELLGKRRIAGQVRARNRRAIQQRKQVALQPYLELIADIDALILEGDRLKLLAEEFLLDPEGVKSRWKAEKEAEVEQLRREAERERLKPEWLKLWEQTLRPDLRRAWFWFRSLPWWIQVFVVFLLVGFFLPR